MRYLVRKREGGRAHLIGYDGDTLCTMASSGGLDMTQYEVIEAHKPPKPLCFMCEGRAHRLRQIAAWRRSPKLR
jgi:hypothetical protein